VLELRVDGPLVDVYGDDEKEGAGTQRQQQQGRLSHTKGAKYESFSTMDIQTKRSVISVGHMIAKHTAKILEGRMI
jgi:hypothetical protein